MQADRPFREFLMPLFLGRRGDGLCRHDSKTALFGSVQKFVCVPTRQNKTNTHARRGQDKTPQSQRSKKQERTQRNGFASATRALLFDILH
mmetsp:Transcript_11405/g.26451  ORF Transcript_11405/g.26451 Transcript_11405/m.26451 type:complete len:91 (+) Transcript_11405:733-1005(+)